MGDEFMGQGGPNESTRTILERLVDRDVADVAKALAATAAELAEYKAHTPTHEDVREEVTGARNSMAAQIGAMASKESVAALKADVDKGFAELKLELAENKPPSIWKLVGLAVGAFFSIVSATAIIVYSASGRVQDIVMQAHDLKRDVEDVNKRLERLEVGQTEAAHKMDRLFAPAQPTIPVKP